jgi:predicted RNA binding protein YcfA (HicA-like mRNA interferase family)
MNRSKRWTVRDLRQRLREMGCVHLRTNGSHEIWATPDGATIPPFVGKHANEVIACFSQVRFFAQRGLSL